MVDRLLRFIGITSSSQKPKIDEEKMDELKYLKGEIVEDDLPQTQHEQVMPKIQGIIIDSETGEKVEEVQAEIAVNVRSIKSPNELSSTLPGEIVRLAAQNKAFFQGILALQKLQLDDDLFQDAVETLKQKYYKKREVKR